MVAPARLASKLDATLQEATLHHQAGRLSEAERLYRRVLRERPSHPQTNNALGILLKDQGKVDEATTAFRRVAAVAPDSPDGHNNLGLILSSQGKLEEAEACFRRAVALNPNMADTLKNLALVIVNRGNSTQSFEWFRRYAELTYGQSGSTPVSAEPIPPHKMQHDQEQRDYLAGGAVSSSAAIFNLEAGDRVPGRAVNPGNSGDAAAKWETSTPQYVVIDNLLTDAALEGLRRFCWRSTIWHRAHRNGYVGAMPEHGFVCPLLAQIDEEIRSTYPTILGQHPLLRWWGFKYDSQLRGINVHADFAAVNINFWITPDEANLDPESGGLVIWDKAAPLHWGFAQYNGAGQSVRDYLDQTGARSVAVPHRANRAVIFDSDLFHETDQIAFKTGYLNRRINITMLYGQRASAKPS